MKKGNESKSKGTISQLVLGIIKAKQLHKAGRSPKADGVAVIAQVKRDFPGSKFSQAHYAWYLSRFRKQSKEGLGVDKLHFGKTERKPKATTKKAPAKVKKAAKAPKAKAAAEVKE